MTKEYKVVSQAEAQARVDTKHALSKAGVAFDIQESTESLLNKIKEEQGKWQNQRKQRSLNPMT